MVHVHPLFRDMSRLRFTLLSQSTLWGRSGKRAKNSWQEDGFNQKAHIFNITLCLFQRCTECCKSVMRISAPRY